MGVLRTIAGLAVAVFALAYMGIGAMFMTGGPPFDTGAGAALALTGLIGICSPVMLLGLHLAFSGRAAPLRRRKQFLGALLAGCCIGFLGSLYALLQADLRPDAASLMGATLLSTVLFGWPILYARFAGRDR